MIHNLNTDLFADSMITAFVPLHPHLSLLIFQRTRLQPQYGKSEEVFQPLKAHEVKLLALKKAVTFHWIDICFPYVLFNGGYWQK